MRALVEAMRDCRVSAHPAVVVAPSSAAPALDVAASLEVATTVCEYDPAESFSSRLIDAISGCDWLCLAGYLRRLPVEVVNAMNGRVLNIHPAILPKFGGKGMYGHHVHEAVLAAGERESGCTVHWVTENYDEGAAVLQMRCSVLLDDTPEVLGARVLALEHQAYAQALQQVILAAR